MDAELSALLEFIFLHLAWDSALVLPFGNKKVLTYFDFVGAHSFETREFLKRLWLLKSSLDFKEIKGLKYSNL